MPRQVLRPRAILRPVLWSLLAVLACTSGWAAENVDVAGVWSHEGRFGRTEMTFASDGTFRRVAVRDGKETIQLGRYEVQGDALQVRTADGQVARYKVRRSRASLTLVDADGSLALDRAGPPPATLGNVGPTIAPPALPGAGAGNEPLRPRVPVTASASGHLLFSRWVAGQGGMAPRRVICLMDGEGRGAAPFIVPPTPWDAFEAAWSADGSKVVFASTYELMRSALNVDIFLADVRTRHVVRVTGNEHAAPPVGGRAKAALTVAGKVGDPETVFKQLRVSWQGGGGRVVQLLGEKYTGKLDDLPANQTIWIKARANSFVGCLQVVQTPAPGKSLKIKCNVNLGMSMATCPSLTPDGRHLVVLWQHAFYNPKPRKKKHLMHGSYTVLGLKWFEQPEDTEEWFANEDGVDTIAVIDVAKGTPPISGWDPIQMNGRFAKHPKVSPDGRQVAFTMGILPTESIAVCSLASLKQGRPQPRVLVPGRLVPAQYSVGNAYPAWSPDGRSLAFCQVHSTMDLNFAGNLCVVGADGSGARVLTRLRRNQVVAWPTWSPDGRRIAFQLITSKRDVLHPFDIATGNVVSDIYTVAADGSDPRQLTQDGLSAEPAWGR